MITLTEQGKYVELYQKVQHYLDTHFDQLPPVTIFYDDKKSLIVVEVGPDPLGFLDSFGLLQNEDTFELDAVSRGQRRDLTHLYGYHDEEVGAHS